jgi:AraC-like DNA-binding protein
MSSRASAVSFLRSRRTITEPDEFRDVASGISLKVDFQRRQERPSQVDQFQTSRWALDFGQAHVSTRVRGILSTEVASLCLVRGPGDSRWNSHSSPPGSIALLPPGEELDGRTDPGFSWVTVAVPAALWRQCQQVAGVEVDRVRNLAVCELSGPLLEQLHWRLLEIQRQLRSTFPTASLTHEVFHDTATFAEECFTSACELAARLRPLRGSVRNRARLARRADQWMRDHLAESVQVSSVCLALGVSRRELEYAFRSTFDQSPRDHFEAIRLNAIRRSLLQADPGHATVIDIAQDHGITHLGRFARRYQVLFGEKPRETLKR